MFGVPGPLACNFNPSASQNDDSCTYPDCNGDCGGEATNSPCGCIGGNTGIAEDRCINNCLSDELVIGESGCSPGILNGQTFVAASTGFISRVQLMCCCAFDTQLKISTIDASDPCSSETATDAHFSDIAPATCNSSSSCLTSSGIDGYQWRDFHFPDFLLVAGRSYRVDFVTGFGLASCGNDYPDGEAMFNSEPSPFPVDLAMKVLSCSDGVVTGCTDESACQGFDPAATVDDGSCGYPDCNGDCNGQANTTQGCGCIGGATGIREVQCLQGQLHNLIANDGAICQSTLKGQQFTVSTDGFLLLGEFHVQAEASQTIQIHREDGPLAGEWLGEASRPGNADPCMAGMQWETFSYPSIPLEGGRQYELTFLNGEGSSTCQSDYTAGEGLNHNFEVSNDDLAFRLVFRSPDPGELIWGCTDPLACNFNPDATHENGSCSSLDCNGDCGGDAYVIEGCG